MVNSGGEFYAHSRDDVGPEGWEPLVEHLAAVAFQAGLYCSRFGAENWGRAAGFLHDLGKYTPEFQRLLFGEIARAEHSIHGAAAARELYGAGGDLIAYAIAGHHAGAAGRRGVGSSCSLIGIRRVRCGIKTEKP